MTDCTKCWWHGEPIDCPADFNLDTYECKNFETEEQRQQRKEAKDNDS